MRRNRFLAAAMLAAAVAVSTGCAASPPPVSDQVQKYYDTNKDRPLGAAVTPAATATAAQVPFGFDTASIKAALAANHSVVISVLGDSTGNEPTEWVGLWAKQLSKSAQVSLHSWDLTSEAWSTQVTKYGSVGTRKIEIWNGSQPGAKADYPASRIKVIQPVKPDFVILSFGHNGAPSEVTPTFTATTGAITAQWGKVPTVAIIQNKAGEPRAARTDENQAEVRAWATATKTPIIDVRAAFDKLPDLGANLLEDGSGVHPNAAGEQVWADAVSAILG